jgi:hypothetical protein
VQPELKRWEACDAPEIKRAVDKKRGGLLESVVVTSLLSPARLNLARDW